MRCRAASSPRKSVRQPMGAAALGGVDRFFERFRRFGPEVAFVESIDQLDPQGLNDDVLNYAKDLIICIILGHVRLLRFN